jgi:ectoine hydroxylase-related dioxygenase (phytanoyl-CoA dioxygenase family)
LAFGCIPERRRLRDAGSFYNGREEHAMATSTAIEKELNEAFPLTNEQIEFFRENGFIKLSQALPPDLLQHYKQEITRKVYELNTQHLPLEKRSTYDKAFLQIMNLWTRSEAVREFVFGKRLARIATELMGCRGVRIYHDQALYKEAGGGITPWHADQYYWPVSNANMVTAWIPLQDTPLDMGPLAFCAGSHRLDYGRDLEISDESEEALQRALAGFQLDEGPFALGDVSFHAGWTFHRAGANTTRQPREVMTIIYMDQDMRLVEAKNKHQVNDTQTWCPGVRVGETIASPLNPLVYSKEA